MRLLTILAAVVLFSAIIACSNSNQETSIHSFRIFDDDGITIAETTGGPKFEGELFQYESVLEVKQNQQNPESLLSRPYPFVTDKDDNIFVPDPFNHRIAVYDPMGQYLRHFGRAGEGPTDFQFPRIHAIKNNIITVFDSQLGRSFLYSTEGELLEVITMPGGYSRALEALFLLPETDNLLAFRRYQDVEQDNGVWRYISVVVMDKSGNALKTIETESALENYEVPESPGFSRSSITVPIGPRAVFAYLPGIQFLLSCGSQPHIDIYELSGNRRMQIRMDLQSQPISEPERQIISDRFDQLIDRNPESIKPQIRREKEYLILPEQNGYWDEAFFDGYGHIWLRTPELNEVRKEMFGPSFRILSPDGEYLGTTRWPCGNGRIQDGQFLGLVLNTESGGLVPTVFKISSRVTGFRYPE